ncbi:MAG: sugar phosphate isomerase/epimerase [Treponema sp.]|nr:sugar phosphate isomerase/epimerase [Treponema sp.]
MGEIKFGVSPAYYISRFSDNFTPEEMGTSLKDIKALGFSHFQLEVFHPWMLKDWVKGGVTLVAGFAEKAGLTPSQFVGHFLLHGFITPKALESSFGTEEMRSCVEILRPFPDCTVITVVIPTFDCKGVKIDVYHYRWLWDRFAEKIRIMMDIAGENGKKLALEVLPGSILGGLQGILRLTEKIGTGNLGYNFDTGHAWTSRECIELISPMLAGRIFGTHLKDIDPGESRSLRPGKGAIPWDSLVWSLLSSEYAGSWDLEINCDREKTEEEYGRGLEFLKSKLLTPKGE